MTSWEQSVTQSVFIRKADTSIDMLAIHVDDIAIAGHSSRIAKIKEELNFIFDMNDLGELTSMIGFHITRNRSKRTITLSQSSYASKIVERLGLSNANPSPTPLNTHVKLTPTPKGEVDPEMADAPYHLAIGSLMYLAMGTRPDLTFAVQHLSQFASNPSSAHWTAVKRAFCYVKGTYKLSLTLGNTGSTPSLEGFTDADWGSDINDRKSISGFLFQFLGPISWSSKKQATTALSSMEAEYMALTHATREAIWLRSCLSKLHLPQSSATPIHVDNQAAISFANAQDFHMRTKHIDICHHFCREKIASGEIAISYINTTDNLADLFTKALPTPRHRDLVKKLGLTAGVEEES